MLGSRRTFLTTSISALMLPSHLPPAFAETTKTRWMGCRETNGEHRASLFDDRGNILVDIPLPARGHGVITSPSNKNAIAFARRPGTFAFVISLETGTIAQEITASAGRHFYGHGCFSEEGRYLYTTENEIETGEGMIGIRDAENSFSLIASYPSGGIGPHELAFMPDGKTLVIANGGIKTHPELGRTKLNLDTMSPSLVLMGAQNGRIKESHKLAEDHHQLSIRHMSVAPSGVALALQYEGPKTDHMPVLAQFDGTALRLAETPDTLARAMRNYAGSVTHDLSGQVIGLTSPRGNLVSFWDAITLSHLGSHTLRDVCGIAPGHHAGEFLLAGGAETMRGSLSAIHSPSVFADTQWDNHLVHVA